jgi:diguanylate cyclase (GGDEF)-like protein/PAS domain S-box-containing protein
MLTSLLKRWFSPPVFEGDLKRIHQASLLNMMTITPLVIVVPIFFANFLDPQTPIRNFFIDFFMITVVLYLRHHLYRGRITFVALSSLVFGFFSIIMTIASDGTILAPATSVFLLWVVMATVLFELRGFVFSTIATSLAVIGLILAQRTGILPAPVYTVSLIQWFVLTLTTGVTGGLTYVAYQTTQESLMRAEQEIAKREHVELELRKLTRAVEQSPVSIVITNLEGLIEYVNPRFVQDSGYSSAEVLGKNPRILNTDLTPPETYSQLWKTITAGKEWRGEFVNRRKDGSLYDETATISSITDLHGVVTHYIAVKEDITERKQIEQSLQEVRSRLHLLSDNLETAALYVYSHDTQGQPHFEYLSTGMEKLTGIKIEDGLRDAATLHSLILPEYRPRLLELEIKSREDLTSFEMEVRQRHAMTGEIHWVLLRSTPRRRPDGSTVWYGVQMDISERKRNEQLLEAANEDLRRYVEEIEHLHAELREQSLRDPLTGLHNRRYVNETLGREMIHAERENLPVSFILADIDHFKKINDTYGHQVGDKVLVEIARLIKEHARGSDIVCRYGGEEFLLVFLNTTRDDAAKRAEEIRHTAAGLRIPHENGTLMVTISFGLATYPDHGNNAEELIIKADQALYQSKHSGRNRVTIWQRDDASGSPSPVLGEGVGG